MNRVLAHTGTRCPIVQEAVAEFFAITIRLGGLATTEAFG